MSCVLIHTHTESDFGFILFYYEFIFLNYFRFTAKIKAKYSYPIYPPPSCMYITSPIINISHQSDTAVKIDKPNLTYHAYTKTIIYITVHPWCCTFCGFGQTYNGMHSFLWSYRVFSLPYESPVSCLFISPSPSTPRNYRSFYCFIVLPFPECHTVVIIQDVTFLGWLLSLSDMHLTFLLFFMSW